MTDASRVPGRAPRRILFVCTGNTCRSAMAEHLFRHKAREAGLTEAEAKSAGVAARPGWPSPPEALQALEKLGIRDVKHRSQPLSAELVDWADLILTMETGHQTVAAARFPAAVGKVRVLKSYAGLPGRRDIPDPIGQGQEVYDACAVEIAQALDKILEKLTGGTP